jgi:hypothetical protein
VLGLLSIAPAFIGQKSFLWRNTIMAYIKNATLAIILFTALLVFQATSADAAGRDAFSAGSARLAVIVGNGYAFNDTYLIIGVGAAYFVADGLDLGLDLESWTGGNPGITKVSPRLDYVFNTGGSLRPYAGVFYRRTMIEGLDDLDSIGGRAGLYFMSGKGVYVGAGLVYESYLSCQTSIYSSCDDTYPELIVAFSF